MPDNDKQNYLTLFWIQLSVSFRNAVDFFINVFRFYPDGAFAKVDLYLLMSYFFNNPFRISKRFLLERKDPNIYAYGETPLSSLDEIVRECGISAKDTVYELGCGRGRTCFWLNAFIGCKTVGIEYIPEFVQKAQNIKNKFHLKNIEFHCEDMGDADFSDATVIYLYGTCLEDDFIRKLERKFAKLPAGTKIITVSYSLPEYAPEGRYEIMKRFPVRFAWGEGDVYLNVKK